MHMQVALAQLQVRKAGMDAEAAAAQSQRLQGQLQVRCPPEPLLSGPALAAARWQNCWTLCTQLIASLN